MISVSSPLTLVTFVRVAAVVVPVAVPKPVDLRVHFSLIRLFDLRQRLHIDPREVRSQLRVALPRAGQVIL